MEKNKFEFQKLELPRQVLNRKIIQNIPDNHINNGHSTQEKQQSRKTLGYYALTAIIFTAVGYQLHKYFFSETPNTKNIQVIQQTIVKPSNDTTKVLSKPTYINFYDSIVFLNRVKGSKKVVSKGFDEYLKKNKLIVKADGNYYNLFCEDLISSYSVGDSIP